MMQFWLFTAVALLPPLALAVAVVGHGEPAMRFIALALASSLAIAELMILSFAFDQSPSTDLALTFALLVFPCTLVLALFEERWL